MKQQSSAVYDVIAGIFVILTVLMLVLILGLLSHKLQPPVSLQPAVAQAPTVFVPPTSTATLSPTPTLVPTLTFTPTLTLTVTPSLTDTPVPPSDTPTLAVSPTSALDSTLTQVALNAQAGQLAAGTQTAQALTAAVQPTGAGGGATSAPVAAGDYPFAQAGTVQFTSNPDPNLSCNVEAIAGQVFDTNHSPLTSQIEIFIFNASGSYKRLANPLPTNQAPFGVGFWLQVINEHAGKNQYLVEVLDKKLEKQISITATIQFTGDCTQNVALVNFSQVKPFVFP